MRDAIIVVGGGLLTCPLIDTALAMDLDVLVFDADRAAPGMKRATHAEVVSTRDPKGAAERAFSLAKSWPIRGVTTAGADVEVSVAAIAEALTLPGHSLECARRCHHKALTRQVLADAGVPGPAFCEIRHPEEAALAARSLAFPLMVKPIDECGSRGVIRVDDSGALAPAVTAAFSYSPASVLLEAYVAGSTHTVECLAIEGHYELLSLIDTHHGYAPFAVELCHHNPSRIDAEAQRALEDTAKRALRAIGVVSGPAKVDFLLDPKRGPLVMEMTARLSGGFHCQRTTPLARGSDNLRAAVDLCLGRHPRQEDLETRIDHHASCVAHFPMPGRVTAIHGLAETRAIPGVAEVVITTSVGEKIGPYESSADRRVFVIASAPSEAECDAIQDAAQQCLVIETVPCDEAAHQAV